MRTELGSRLLRVLTPDGKVRYFTSAPGRRFDCSGSSVNFGNLKDSVLSVEQRAFIRQIYRTGEVPRAAVDPTKVLGTLEVTSPTSAPGWAAPARVIQLAIVLPAMSQEPHSSQPREVTTLGSVVAQETAQGTGLDPRPNVMESFERGTTPSSSGEPASSDSPEVDDIGLHLSSLARPIRNAQPRSAHHLRSMSRSSLRNLRLFPQVRRQSSCHLPDRHRRPVLADFSPVSQDTEVILRAIVSADGSVTKVKILAGNSRLAREAARAVASWRYSPRSSRGDAESLIAFRFLAPDTVSVAFQDPAARDARR